jgi:hypothetical protein
VDTSSLEYKRAFEQYLRKGIPIGRSIKKAQTTTHYIWRTRRDGKVRQSHAANNGKIFAWNNPPSTGHPGEDYGCRCTAEPYVHNLSEHINIALNKISDSGSPWSSADFVDHYFNGGGRGVTVRETGHLQAIVGRYMRLVEKSLQNNIALKARENPNGSFSDDFRRSYEMEGIVFSLGNTMIKGLFTGRTSTKLGVTSLQGEISFSLEDSFEDPADLVDLFPKPEDNVEIIDLGETILENIHRPLDNYLRGKPTGPIDYGIHTGEPYAITDTWTGAFEGTIHADKTLSAFG